MIPALPRIEPQTKGLARPLATLLARALLACGAAAASVDPTLAQAGQDDATPQALREPWTLTSRNGHLDVLMIAEQQAVPVFSAFAASGWVYTVCERPRDGSEHCPAGASSPNPYGGTRLQLRPGDTLRVHLVNRLPPAPDVEHAADPGLGFLALNPTNLHAHGLLVSPHYPATGSSTWGDNVFVYAFNRANGAPEVSEHLHAAAQMNVVDYEYQIPAHHPAGVYWFHPHVHGISGAQITSGMAGLITIGSVADALCTDGACAAQLGRIAVRDMLLKDTQILPGGSIMHNQDSTFCQTDTTPGSSSPIHRGGCAGADSTAFGGANYIGGRWFFTVNGQAYPGVDVSAPLGQIWRITNASESATYDLDLWQPDEQRELALRVLAIDGVSIDATTVGTDGMLRVAGNRFRAVPCPDGPGSGVCTSRLHLMPSSRAEVWVSYRGADGKVSAPPRGASAIFRSAGYFTGPIGDNWPAVDLASVEFSRGEAGSLPQLAGQATRLSTSVGLAADMATVNGQFAADETCTALPAGHKRRVFFNIPVGDPDGFGLGYEEIDAHGVPVPGTFSDVKPFDPSAPTICLPLASGNQPAVERWELINLAGEDHNFHIHQVHFRSLSAAEIAGTALPPRISGQAVMMDSLPLPHADGTCNTVDDWRAGRCTAHPATVEIPFAIAGDFVYHCHILEHEDGGMMAIIRVRPDAGEMSTVAALTNGLDRLLIRLGIAPSRNPDSVAYQNALASSVCKSAKRSSRATLNSRVLTTGLRADAANLRLW